MSGRRAMLFGLLSGMVTALVAGTLVVALAPETTGPPPTPPASAVPGPGTGAGPVSPAASAGSSGPGFASPGTSGSAPSSSAPPPSGGPTASVSGPGGDPFHVGEPAPSLRVRQLGGGTIDLSKLRGHPVWIEFMATWCPSCRDEFPHMNGFAARYADQGLVVAAIDVREDEGTVAAFARQLDGTFPVGLDNDGKAAAAWGAIALPTHFFIDASGVVRDGALGGIGPDVMAAGLRTIMPGVSVTP